MSELTAKQKAFKEELPKNQWNGTKAAIAAGYSKKSAGVMAHRLLKNPKIAEELEKRMGEIAEKTDVEIAEIVAALRKFAFGGKKATNTEQLKALELLGKFKAMFTDRIETEQTEQVRELTEREKEQANRIAKVIIRENLGMDTGYVEPPMPPNGGGGDESY
jgi:phage terminase small subunit